MAWQPCTRSLAGDVAFLPEQQQQLRDLLHQTPELIVPQQHATRWKLALIAEAVPWLRHYSLSGIWRVLMSLRIHYKRGRHALHSPDPEYQQKVLRLEQCIAEARAHYPEVVLLYLDEMSYYRQPTLASAWWAAGTQQQPLGRLSHRNNSRYRIVGALDAISGRVIFVQTYAVVVQQMASFYPQVRQAYPSARRIYLVQDNWPVHLHQSVQQAAAETGIEIVQLPTYAPWLNPIEKLWRKLKQEVLHLHRSSDQWEELRNRVQRFLEGFAEGSAELLRYVGLSR